MVLGKIQDSNFRKLLLRKINDAGIVRLFSFFQGDRTPILDFVSKFLILFLYLNLPSGPYGPPIGNEAKDPVTTALRTPASLACCKTFNEPSIAPYYSLIRYTRIDSQACITFSADSGSALPDIIGAAQWITASIPIPLKVSSNLYGYSGAYHS